jgi:hypothetical protein
VPRWNTISISGYHIREAGSDAVQEVAFTLADGITYVDAARAAGLAVDAFAPRLSFFFNAHANLLEEIAKFRAARLWARIMHDRFGAKDPRAQMLRFHADRGLDAGGGATAEQRRAHDDRGARRRAGRRPVAAHERLRRGAGAADEASARPRPAHAADPADAPASPASWDPVGGSYAIEALTSERTRAAALIAEIDRRGGMLAAIGRLPAAGDRASRPEHQRAVEAGARDRGREPLRGRNNSRRSAAAAPAGSDVRSGSDRASCRRASRRDGSKRAPRWTRRGGRARNRQPGPGHPTPSRPVPQSVRSPDVLRNIFGNTTHGSVVYAAVIGLHGRGQELPLFAVRGAASAMWVVEPARNTDSRDDDDEADPSTCYAKRKLPKGRVISSFTLIFDALKRPQTRRANRDSRLAA